ncbi:MAG: threonine/serine exporter family protein [Ileibacterium sp.]|nr:threonine/serine exporter family protein [Ileibacterium sp.]
MTFIETAVRGFFGAGVASLGFAILFNIRGKEIFYACLAGGTGGLVYNLLVYFGMNPVVANFFAALALSACGEVFARMLKCTVSTFVACALIPLVPGGTAYEMMVSFLDGKIYAGLQKGLDMVTISGMLTLGILTVATLTRFFFYTRKRLKGLRSKS